jgi:hypothetical protein
MQIGQREDVVAVGAGTVWMRRRLVEDTGAPGFVGLEATADGRGDGVGGCGGGEESETVFVVMGGGEAGLEDVFGFVVVGDLGDLEGSPDMTGGGRSRPSAAFLDN